MRRVMLLAALLLCLPILAAAQPRAEVAGCQGEGCDCFAAYREAAGSGRRADFEIPLVRPLRLHARADEGSAVLGQFEAPAKARPLRQFVRIVEPGLYTVTAIQGRVEGLRKGDRLHTLIDQGEGYASASKLGSRRTVQFSSEAVSLSTVRATVTEDWMEVSAGRLRGYARGHPFEGCLE